MTTTVWIILGAVVFAIGYVVAMRNLLNRSRDLEKKINHAKLRQWTDDEDGDVK